MLTDSLTSIKGAVPIHAMKACMGVGRIAPLLHKEECVGQLSVYRQYSDQLQYVAPAEKKRKETRKRFAPHGVFVLL